MSRSRDFSLTRAYFFPREVVILATPNIPIECMFCKNFYTFRPCFLCIWFATKLRAKCGKCRFAPQKCRFLSKNAIKRRKPISSLLCRKRAERHTELVFWMQKRAKRTKKRHFSHKPKNYRITLTFNTLNKNHCIF